MAVCYRLVGFKGFLVVSKDEKECISDREHTPILFSSKEMAEKASNKDCIIVKVRINGYINI